jgi:hypothetical protein
LRVCGCLASAVEELQYRGEFDIGSVAFLIVIVSPSAGDEFAFNEDLWLLIADIRAAA